MPIFIERIAEPTAADFNDLVKIYSDYPVELATTNSSQALSLWLRKQLSNPQNTLYAARFNGRLLGAMWIFKASEQNWKLEYLCVRELTRRRGIGDKLISEILMYAKESGAELDISITPEDLPPEILQSLDQLTQRYSFNPLNNDNTYVWKPAD